MKHDPKLRQITQELEFIQAHLAKVTELIKVLK